ncbi:MAG: hypothetical protein ABSC25_17560 [Roseiarcus sp.]|jgi:hypothetical protein
MALGLMTMLVPALVAMRGRGIGVRDGALASLPIYYALISAASWVAVFDLAIRPFYWAKTEHGRARGAPERPRAEAVPCE